MAKINFGDYTIKNIKTARSSDGRAIQGSLYRDGTKIGFAMDEGSGGPAYVEDISKEEMNALYNYAKSQPMVVLYGEPIPVDVDLFIGLLLEETYANNRIKKMCSTKTVFDLKKKGAVTTCSINLPFTAKVARQLREEHGNNLVKIHNEDYI